MDSSLKKQLAVDAANIRLAIIEGTFHAKSGHPGGSLSITETVAYLYRCVLKVDPKNPHWADRDRLVLSKGHTAPALYGALALHGFFPESEIARLRKPDSFLQGHPDMQKTPGVDMSTGSLGQGVSAAAGMALAGKLDNKDYHVYAILGDGEIEEGQVWEAAMFASAKGLDNLTLFIDNNNLQIDGCLEEVNSPYPIKEKFEAFGFTVFEADGHDFDSIDQAVTAARAVSGKPTAIVLKTVKGHGVSFMENQVGWHGKATNAEEYEAAMAELKAALKACEEA